MNYKYRKLPVTIEAFQMTAARRWGNSDWPEWLHKAWNLDYSEEGSFFCVGGGAEVYIRTLEGCHLVSWDDWIIQGVKGEIYPCKSDIFDLTYALVDES